MINLVINGETLAITADTSLAQLLVQLDCDNAVLTAVNDSFVPCNNRAAHILRDGDRVELLSPMEGG